MDDIVKQAMAKWPNVPACHGWLGLDDRGHWWMRDAQAQAAGPFQSKGEQSGACASRGSRLQHEQLIAFIGRNYASDGGGAWYFQNGPQRVFVELMRTPWVCRVSEDAHTVTLHTGAPASVRGLWLDEEGAVYVETDLGLALVHSQDVGLVADHLEQGHWAAAQSCTRADLPSRFGYVLSPQAQAGVGAST